MRRNWIFSIPLDQEKDDRLEAPLPKELRGFIDQIERHEKREYGERFELTSSDLHEHAGEKKAGIARVCSSFKATGAKGACPGAGKARGVPLWPSQTSDEQRRHAPRTALPGGLSQEGRRCGVAGACP